MVEFTYNEQYKQHQLDLRKGVKQGESFEFELQFDTPISGDRIGKDGKPFKYYIFKVTMGDKDVSFFASGMLRDKKGRLEEELQLFKKGDKVRLTKTISDEEIRGAYRPLWVVEAVGVTSAPTPSTPTPAPQAQSVESVLVDLLVHKSGGVQQNDGWLNAQLDSSEVKDESIRTSIKNAYNKKW